MTRSSIPKGETQTGLTWSTSRKSHNAEQLGQHQKWVHCYIYIKLKKWRKRHYFWVGRWSWWGAVIPPWTEKNCDGQAQDIWHWSVTRFFKSVFQIATPYPFKIRIECRVRVPPRWTEEHCNAQAWAQDQAVDRETLEGTTLKPLKILLFDCWWLIVHRCPSLRLEQM